MTESVSAQVDLDWSQVRETVKLLTVSVAQVDASMKNGDSSVNTLTDFFTSMVGQMNAINTVLNSLESGDQKDTCLNHCEKMTEKIHASIVAFQFYDRLQQSLSHVVAGLQGLSLLIENPDRLYNPQEWKKFQDEIRNNFTMESEKVMFDAILQGQSIEEAIQLAASVDDNSNNEDDIELF